MRPDLVVLSASALVMGVMCLVFGAALSPADGSGGMAAVRLAGEQSERWLAMAVLWFCASVALTAGMPAILSLFQARAHRLGTLGVIVLSVGAIGTSGFAMVLASSRRSPGTTRSGSPARRPSSTTPGSSSSSGSG